MTGLLGIKHIKLDSVGPNSNNQAFQILVTPACEWRSLCLDCGVVYSLARKKADITQVSF